MVLFTTSRNSHVACCHVSVNVCAEVLARSVGSGLGSENTAALTNPSSPKSAESTETGRKIYDTSQLQFSKDPNHELPLADPDAVAFSPDGSRLITAGANDEKQPTLIAWDTATWKKMREVRLQRPTRQVAFTADQKYLVLTSGDDETVRLLDPNDMQERNAITAAGKVICFAISPDGRFLATISSHDWKIQIWNLDTRTQSRTLTGPAELTSCIVYSPDGRSLASTGKRIHLWNLETGLVEKTLSHDSDGFASFSAAFSPDNAKLAASCNDGHTRVYEVATGELLESFQGKQANVFSVLFSPDGRTLITRSMEGTSGSDANAAFLLLVAGSDVCIWNLATHSMMANLGGPMCVLEPYSVAYSPDGRTIVATRNDSIGVWTGTEQ